MKMKMRILFLLSIVVYLYSCSTSNVVFVGPEMVEQETLIMVYSKIPSYGTIYFLRKNSDKRQLLEYTYNIDIKKRKSTCNLRHRKTYEDKDIPKEWMTAESFRISSKFCKKYYNCLIDGFLDLDNDKKIEALNRFFFYQFHSFETVEWRRKDLVDNISFSDTCQIVNWGHHNATMRPSYQKKLSDKDFRLLVQTKELSIDNQHLFFLLDYWGSGIAHYKIYVFKKEGDQWTLRAEGRVAISDGLMFSDGIKVVKENLDSNKIVFTKFKGEAVNPQSDIIGELHLEDL
jgi:hypothetical protein